MAPSVFPKKGVYLAITKEKNSTLALGAILKEFTDRGEKGLCVTLKLPALTWVDRLKNEKVDVSKLSFIDCISKFDKTASLYDLYLLRTDAPECRFIEDPGSLTELSLAINEKAITGKFNFVIIRSLNDLFTYNPPELTEDFVRYLVAKLRDLDILTIALAEPKENTRVKKVELFFDKVLSI